MSANTRPHAIAILILARHHPAHGRGVNELSAQVSAG
jgi:hypothetical protein